MFGTEKKSESLDSSTFDIVQVDAFHNTRFWTVMSYLWVWILVLLTVAILASDTYTCVSILVFHRWSSNDIQVYEYRIAKWIFTGCILFRFLLLAYQISWGIHIYRTRNIALAYLNNYSRLFYAVRSYDYQCLFHEIEHEGFFQWACFFIYFQLDDALQILVADLPRQVINFMTLRFYATGGGTNNDILSNIRSIAETNLRLSIILSVQLLSIAIFLFFFLSFVVAILLFIPIKVKVSNKGYKSFKAYCYRSVNDKVRFLVRRNHKPKEQILDEGLMNLADIQANPLLGSSTTFDARIEGNSNPFSSNPLDRYETQPFGRYDSPVNPFEDPVPRNKFGYSGSNISLTDLSVADTEAQGSSRSLFVNSAGNDTPTSMEFPRTAKAEIPRTATAEFSRTATAEFSRTPTTEFPGTEYPNPKGRYVPLAPPGRTQTTDSLASRRDMNSHIYNDDANKQFRRGNLDVHSAGSRSNSSADLLHPSAPEHSSSESLDFGNKSEKKPEFTEYPAPYPVRGVSTYMEDEDLSEWEYTKRE